MVPAPSETPDFTAYQGNRENQVEANIASSDLIKSELERMQQSE